MEYIQRVLVTLLIAPGVSVISASSLLRQIPDVPNQIDPRRKILTGIVALQSLYNTCLKWKAQALRDSAPVDGYR